MKKKLSLILALLMLVSSLASCASSEVNDAPENTETPTSSAETVAETEETEITRENIPDNLPELDYEGTTVTIHSRGDDESFNEVYIEEMTGEPVNDAVYDRNQMVNERLNVDIVGYRGEGWESYNNAVSSIRSSIMSGDGAYDIIAGWSARIPLLSLEGLFLNLNEFKYIDFEQPWWNQSCVEELQIGDQLHFITGDIAKTMLSAMCVYVFNQKLATDYGIENLYDVVKEKRWTIDYIYELTSAISIDLDGDGQMTASDSYGLTTSCINDADGYMQGFRVSMINRDEAGMPVLDVNEERMTTIVERVYNLDWNNPGAYVLTNTETDLNLIKEDRALMTTTRVTAVVSSLSEMESDFGVLPYPLLDETQSEYGTRVQDALSLWCVPIDAKNPEMSGAVMEALGAQSYRTVTPAYFDVALKNRYSRDQETAEMMDLIVNSVLINFESLYNEAIGNPWFVLRTLMPSKNSNFTSYWASNKKVIGKKLEKAIEQVQAGN